MCVVAVVAAVLFFAGWQLVMPPGFASVRGLNPRAVDLWRTWMGLSPSGSPSSSAMPLGLYTAVFRGSLIVGWIAYAGLLWLVRQGAGLGARWVWRLAVPLTALLICASPASLSTDVFAYVGYGRLAVVHGLNPHTHAQTELFGLGDPIAPYLQWPISSPYGPLWTLISMAVVWLCPGGSILGAVIALKACAGAALLGAAAAARAVVRPAAPKLAGSVFVLVALNPLLLVEGPGNGHNDLVMMAFLAAGWAALDRGRLRLAAALVGVAAAVKLVPLLMVPWMVALALRGTPPRWGARAMAGMLALVLTLAPVVVTYQPFWVGLPTLGGLAARWRKGASAPAAATDGERPVAPVAHHPDERPAREPEGATPNPNPNPPSKPAPSRGFELLAALARGALRVWPVLLIYVWGTLAMSLGRGPPAMRLASVWCCTALGGLIFAAGLWFPWYLAWFWIPIVFRFTSLHLALMAFALPLSVLLMLVYAVPPG